VLDTNREFGTNMRDAGIHSSGPSFLLVEILLSYILLQPSLESSVMELSESVVNALIFLVLLSPCLVQGSKGGRICFNVKLKGL